MASWSRVWRISIGLALALAAMARASAGELTQDCLAASGHDAVLRCQQAVAADPADTRSLRALG
jgi:hypothetical protein